MQARIARMTDEKKPVVPPEHEKGDHGDKGTFRDQPLRKGYQTPQEEEDHWQSPDSDK
jgi:hypothetical protein